MNYGLKIFSLLTCIGLISLLTACGKKEAVSDAETMTVKPNIHVTNLYLSGIVRPISINPITCPVDGAVEQINFRYGEPVKKNQLLFMIISNTLQKSYQDTLSSYLTAEQRYSNNKASMDSAEFLFKNGLISKDDYRNTNSQLHDSQLSLIQARIQLENVLKIANIPIDKIKNLKIGDVDTIETEFIKPTNRIGIFSNRDGVALLPEKKGTSDTTVRLGGDVKTGQVLVTIGDLAGLSFDVDVDEISISKVQPGLKAIITSPAFPTVTLNGYVDSIKAQADEHSGGGLPTFGVHLIAPKLTPEEQKQIFVGMTAKVNVSIEKPVAIFLPITAVFKKNDGAYVQVIDKKTGKPTPVAVKTGATTMDTVEILSGLNPGDNVVIGH